MAVTKLAYFIPSKKRLLISDPLKGKGLIHGMNR